jgi:hypothetical protein
MLHVDDREQYQRALRVGRERRTTPMIYSGAASARQRKRGAMPYAA